MASPAKKKKKPDDDGNYRDNWYVHMGKYAYDFAFVHKVTGEVAYNQNEMLVIDRKLEMQEKSVLYEDNHGNRYYVTENQDKIGALMGDRLPQAGGIYRVKPRVKEVINVDTRAMRKATTRRRKQQPKQMTTMKSKHQRNPNSLGWLNLRRREWSLLVSASNVGMSPVLFLNLK